MRVKTMVTGCLLFLFGISLFQCLLQQRTYQKAEVSRQEAESLVFETEDVAEEAASDLPVESMKPEPEPVVYPDEVDELFSMEVMNLQEVNPDVIGWLVIPDTGIGYPLLHGMDNAYYLSHDWQGEENRAGALFLDCRNQADFTDFGSIVYGHNMRDGSMFGTLKQYEDMEFLSEHAKLYVRLSDKVLEYQVMGAYMADADGVLYQADQIETEAYVREELGLTGPCLFLSTCTNTGYETRFVVYAVLQTIWEQV